MTNLDLYENVIDAEIIDDGRIVRAFLAAGRFIESIIQVLGQARRWLWRNVRSFVGWMGELAADWWLRQSMRRLARKAKPKTKRELPPVFRWIGVGAAVKVPKWWGWYLDNEGHVDASRAKLVADHRFEQVSTLLDDESIKKHDAASKVRRTRRREHAQVLAWHIIPPSTAIALWIYYGAPLPHPYVITGLGLTLLTILTTVFAVAGKQIVLNRSKDVVDFMPALEKITAPHLQHAFELIGLDGTRVLGDLVERHDGDGWSALAQLTPSKTFTDDVLPRRSRLATAISPLLDESQVILSQQGGSGMVKIEVSYTKPSERKMGDSPYTALSQTSIFDPIVWGENGAGTAITVTLSQSLLILGQSTYGKTEGVWNLLGHALLDPTVDVWLCALAGGADFETAAKACKVRVLGSGDDDDESKRNALRAIAHLLGEARARERFMATLPGKPNEVTAALAAQHSRLRPIVFVIDEAHLALSRGEAGENAREWLLDLVQSYRKMGIRIVPITQNLNHKAIGATFVGPFTRKLTYRTGTNHETNAMLGNSAVRLGHDATEFVTGQFAVNGESCGLQGGRAYLWTSEQKEALVQRALELRGGYVEELKFDVPSPKPAEPPADRDLVADIIALGNDGKWGSGVWSAEFPDFCDELGITVMDLKAALDAIGVSTSHGIYKIGANKRGFRFDHINQTRGKAS